MQWYEILIIVSACAFVLGVIVWSAVRKKKGKGCCGCSGGCASCSARSCKEKLQK